MVYIIIVSQEYNNANHKNLWHEIANQTDITVVCNISSDLIVSLLKGKLWRIKESFQPYKVFGLVKLIRPFYLVRPELLPFSLQKMIRRRFWRIIRKVVPDIMRQEVRLLSYDAMWINVLKESHPNMKIAYYIYDEVRLRGDNEKIKGKVFRQDIEACKKADALFVMTEAIASSRTEFREKIVVLGNGCEIPYEGLNPDYKFVNSVAFIGNFRNWINETLLSNLIKLRQDLLFVIAGPVEDNMKSFLEELLNNYNNVVYFGIVSKERMPKLYMMFDCIIVPYKENRFIKATRPIKIVESVVSGTPVVTVPVDGYEESSFIRFAQTVQDFSREIDYLIATPIVKQSENYKKFVNGNTWAAKARVILDTLK